MMGFSVIWSNKLDEFDEEDLPPIVVKWGEKSHPMYKPWRRMMDVCTDPNEPAFKLFGGLGITVMHRWFEFENFVADNEALYDPDPSAIPAFRRIYISRSNPKSGFNPKNLVWVRRKQAVAVQAKTITVDTCFGKGMTLKQLAKYLEDHAGEDLPDDAPVYSQWQTVFNPLTEKVERMRVRVTTIYPIKVRELRRRLKRNLPLLFPVRDYSGKEKLDDSIDDYFLEKLDRERDSSPKPY